jgi:hypothetical protein
MRLLALRQAEERSAWWLCDTPLLRVCVAVLLPVFLSASRLIIELFGNKQQCYSCHPTFCGHENTGGVVVCI